MLPILLAVLIRLPAPVGEVVRSTVAPSDTDSAIHTFLSPHSVFLNPSVPSRGQLLVFLPGTNGKTSNTDAFCSTAAEIGYAVINLMYPDDIPATVVRNDKRTDAFLNFRLEVIEGKNLSEAVDVDRANSIENRLIKALQYLDKTKPSEHWGRFLTPEGQPK